jgi:hypothetical protein
MSNSLSDAFRSKSDEEIFELFRVRPDLISPVPTDITALAARANSMPSVMRACEALNKWQFDVLTAICTLSEPVSLIEILSITSKVAKTAVIELQSRGLIYRDGEHFRVPSSVRNLIGENPAGLGPRSQSAIDFELLADAPKGAREVLERMMWGPPKGQVADIKKVSAPIKWLLEHKFLLAFDSQTLLLPREVAMHLRGGQLFKSLVPEQPSLIGKARKRRDIDQAAIANISTVARWVEELGHNWSDEPPTALRSGGLGVRDLKRTAEHLGIDESATAFVAELAYIGGLVVIDTDDAILPTSAFDIWLSRSPEEQWHALASLWMETSRMSGLIGRADSKNIAALGPELDRPGVPTLKKLILSLLSQNPEIDPELASMHESATWLAPARANSEYTEWILREAEWLGLTGQGALSTFGANFLTGDDLEINTALPKPVDHILIQSDNSAIAPGPLTLEVATTMGTIADIESRGGATVYRFTETSIRRGLDHGQTGEQIQDFLRKTSKTPMPQPLEYLITDVAKRHGRLRVGTASSYIRCEDEGVIAQIIHDRKLDGFGLRKLAPQVLIADCDSVELIAVLRESGYLPAAENASGILVSAPKVRRAKSRPKPPRTLVEASSPVESIIEAAVRALRVGEKTRAHKPREVPRTSANETVELLHHHIAERSTLTIGYADTNGGVSNRLIEPRSISLGTLVALDHSSGEIMQFRIPRITGVSISDTK